MEKANIFGRISHAMKDSSFRESDTDKAAGNQPDKMQTSTSALILTIRKTDMDDTYGPTAAFTKAALWMTLSNSDMI